MDALKVEFKAIKRVTEPDSQLQNHDWLEISPARIMCPEMEGLLILAGS